MISYKSLNKNKIQKCESLQYFNSVFNILIKWLLFKNSMYSSHLYQLLIYLFLHFNYILIITVELATIAKSCACLFLHLLK